MNKKRRTAGAPSSGAMELSANIDETQNKVADPRAFRAAGQIPLFLPWILAGSLLALLAGCDGSESSSSSTTPRPAAHAQRDLLSEGRAAIQRGDLAAARQLATERLLVQPDDAAAIVLMGETAQAAAQWDEAIASFDQLRDHHDPLALHASLSAAQIEINRGHLYKAIERLQHTVERFPNEQWPRLQLGQLLMVTGRSPEAVPHYQQLLRQGRLDLQGLMLLANPRHGRDINPIVTKALESVPKDRRPLLAAASMHASKGAWDDVVTVTAEILETHPQFTAAWILNGRGLWETGQVDRWNQWLESPLPDAEQFADYWLALGIAAEDQGRQQEAARAYWEALQREPYNPEAVERLARALGTMGRDEEAHLVSDVAVQLQELASAVQTSFGWKHSSQAAALNVAENMDALGRPWEAEAWARLATSLRQDPDPEAYGFHAEMATKLSSSEVWDPSKMPGRLLDLSDLPLQLKPAQKREQTASQTNSPLATDVRFADQAQERGVRFAYNNSDDPNEKSLWVHQSNGGGVGVLDYDLNGWPDLCFAQAGGQPLASDGSDPRALFRNLGGTFVETALTAGIVDRRFGQGIGVGDYNDDGFPDLLLANIGANRVYRNNGDGTFTDATDEVGLSGDRWTTSMAVADMNGDGFGDILEVNYLGGGTKPYEVACYDHGVPSVCSPAAFPAEEDRFWLSQGDGTFSDQTESMMQTENPGRGLGLLIADFDNAGGLEAFVANDMSANSFWLFDREAGRLVESAAVRGLAFGRNSKPQACMGIASGDVDNNGLLDLCVTNFFDEPNAFYQQTSPGIFVDTATKTGLGEPSLKQLGFGAAMSDFNGDGALELIVTNGHVSESHDDAHPQEMPPQLFAWDGEQWHELPGSSIGPYFDGEYIGRGLSLLDANRDGLMDVVISQLVGPAPLLVNQTPYRGTTLSLRAVASSGPREAVGARLAGSVSGQRRYFQVTAGDGFQGSDQRVLHVGLGNAGELNDATITWPNGQTQQLGALAAGSEYLVVEGRPPIVVAPFEKR